MRKAIVLGILGLALLSVVKAAPRTPQTNSVTALPCWTAATPATCNTFTFDMPRVLASATVCTLRGGGYITATTDTGETAKRYFVTTVPPCSAPTAWNFGFTKLANSVTFSYSNTDPTQYTISSLVVEQRVPSSVTIVAPASLVIDGIVTSLSPPDVTVTVQSGGALFSFPASASPTCIPVTVNDANGAIGQAQLCLPAGY